MSIRILDADEARTTILRRRAWDAWDVPAALLDGIERNFGARLTPDEAVRRMRAAAVCMAAMTASSTAA